MFDRQRLKRFIKLVLCSYSWRAQACGILCGLITLYGEPRSTLLSIIFRVLTACHSTSRNVTIRPISLVPYLTESTAAAAAAGSLSLLSLGIETGPGWLVATEQFRQGNYVFDGCLFFCWKRDTVGLMSSASCNWCNSAGPQPESLTLRNEVHFDEAGVAWQRPWR
jgi:hypothetical protein